MLPVPLKRLIRSAALSLLLLGAGTAATAQTVQEIDPNSAIDADLSTPPASGGGWTDPQSPTGDMQDSALPQTTSTSPASYPAETGTQTTATPTATGTTYQKDDLIGAAEGVFGKGAEGVAGLIEDLLRKQGEPNGYIVGREGGGAFVFGVRYGSGTLYHKVEGQRPVYWRGPSLGIDAGANAGSTFVLVYNLHDSEDVFGKVFAAGEGTAYLVGGFNVSYLRKGDIVLIPVRLGVGARLGVNAGYMRFSKKQKWLPF